MTLIKFGKFYRKWTDMKTRCNNPNFIEYDNYGGRGVKVCERWAKYRNFEEDMLPTYKEGLTLDRIDNDKNYEPSNCRWATRVQQQNNRRNPRLFLFKGQLKTMTQWSRELGIKRTTLLMRLNKYGWGIDKVFTK
jgi:hypothetical protein